MFETKLGKSRGSFNISVPAMKTFHTYGIPHQSYVYVLNNYVGSPKVKSLFVCYFRLLTLLQHKIFKNMF